MNSSKAFEAHNGDEAAASVSAGLAALAERHEWFRLTLGPQRPGDMPIARLADPETGPLSEWLAMQDQAGSGLDPRAQGAYLIGRIGFALAFPLAAMMSVGLAPCRYDPETTCLSPDIYGWTRGGATGTAFRLDVRAAGSAMDVGCRTDAEAQALLCREALVAACGPLIPAIARLTGLSPQAQWRLVADTVASSFLIVGKADGAVEWAMAQARQVVAAAPLANRQLGFLEVPCADGSAGTEWFLARGGCCRYYTCAGGSYCASCVLLPDAEKIERYRAVMRQRAEAA